MREPDYRVVPLPDQWPGTPTAPVFREQSRFKANWGPTLELLARELDILGAREITLAIDVPLGMIRQDGKPKGGARIQNPAVILSFRAGADRLSFPCDRFNWWEDNVRAIALALEALRKIDRCGVQQGKQYQGYKQLASGTAPTMTTAAAARVIAEAAGGMRAIPIAHDFDLARAAVRVARKLTHPDNGGEARHFATVGEATRALEAHFGRTF